MICALSGRNSRHHSSGRSRGASALLVLPARLALSGVISARQRCDALSRRSNHNFNHGRSASSSLLGAAVGADSAAVVAASSRSS